MTKSKLETSRTEYRNIGFIEGLEWVLGLVKIHDYNHLSRTFLTEALKEKINERKSD